MSLRLGLWISYFEHFASAFTLIDTNTNMNTSVYLKCFLCVIYALASRQVNIPSDCRIEHRETVICEESLPKDIPTGVIEVVIGNYMHVNISNNTFTHLNWKNVKKLDIHVNTVVEFTITEYNFYGLNDIKLLGIHSRRLRYLHKNTLLGLNSLRILDFSECSSLSIKQLEAALRTYPYSLESLILDQVGKRSLTISGQFIDMMTVKRISKLSLSGINIFPVGPVKVSSIPPNLKYLDISNSTLLPSRSYSNKDRITLLSWGLKNLEVLNLSSLPYSFLDLDFNVIRKIDGKDCRTIFRNNPFSSLFPKLKVLEVNDLLKYNVVLNSSVINLTCINQVNIRTISLTRNNFQWINITVLLPPDQVVGELDLSSNVMKYLSPNFIGQFSRLKVLNLANNSLGHMERYTELSNIFSNLRYLSVLNIASNSFTKLPELIFASNHKLRNLDLHGNNLKTINFKLIHLRSLRILNLSFNNIVSLDETSIRVLGNEREKGTTYLDLIGNPFVCNCKTVQFIEWVLTTLSVKQDQLYSCLLEGEKILVDKEVIKKSKFLCVRTTIIVLSVVFLVTMATCVFVTIRIRNSRKKRQNAKLTRRRFIEKFLSGRLDKNYISFIAYASEDFDYITNNFCICLNQRLQNILQTDRNLVSTGDQNIAPGYPIMDEVLRCVTEACTLIVITSRYFCESEWCQAEIREAYHQQIPIILLFKEDVEENLMSPVMLAVFKRFTRAKLIVKDGYFETIPEWQMFVESVVNVASDLYSENK